MNNGKVVRIIILFLFFFIILNSAVYASSSYVLPYPSAMPGNKLYKLKTVLEVMESYWYFGNLSRFKYNLSMSDKYLVEAKTLFEYNQLLLAYNSLQKSDSYFPKAQNSLLLAKKEGKNINDKQNILRSASEKHQEVLRLLETQLPEVYTWVPEKEKPSTLQIKNSIENSIRIRQQI